jgi:Zn-dependent protease with chaperone function
MSFALRAALATLGLFEIVVGMASTLLWLLVSSRETADEPGRVARRSFALRVLPAALGFVLSVGVVLPGFLSLEPRDLDERPGATFVLLGLVGAMALASGAYRTLRDLWRTDRLRRRWMREGRALLLPRLRGPAYAIRHPFPIVSMIGFFRPRLIVAEQVLERLSAAELDAVLEHEAAHVAAFDNWKRLALRLVPALPWRAAARRLEERWEEAAEEAADMRASARLELAAALVKTARLVPPGASVDAPLMALHRGGSLVRRVERLTAGSEPAAPRGVAWLPRAAALLALGIGLVWAPVWFGLAQELIEHLVRLP